MVLQPGCLGSCSSPLQVTPCPIPEYFRVRAPLHNQSRHNPVFPCSNTSAQQEAEELCSLSWAVCPSYLYGLCFQRPVFRAPTCTSERLVNGAQVDAGGWRLAAGDRKQPDDCHLGVKLLGPGLCQLKGRGVPAGTFEEQAVDVAALGRRVSELAC